jgi:hypothetical protein
LKPNRFYNLSGLNASLVWPCLATRPLSGFSFRRDGVWP